MEIFAFTQNAVGFEDNGPEPQLRSFDELNLEIPKSAVLGIAGAAAAMAVVGGAPDAQAVVYPGDRCAAVGDLQRALNSAGFSAGPVDNVFGAQTEQAVRNFQSFRGLPVDGIVGPSTADPLGLAGPGSAFEYGQGCGGGTTPPVGGGGPYRVTASSGLNIRSAPSTGASIIGSRGFGSTVSLTDERVTADGFTWGRLATGGWAATSFLSSVDGGGDPPPVGGGGNYRVTASSGVNIRSSASPSASIIGSRGFGSTIALTGERVTSGGFTWGRLVSGGWVATNFLSSVGGDDPTPPIGGGGNYRVTASSGVNIRSSANPSATIIGSRGFGSTIALTGERVTSGGFTWGRLVSGGWVATNFLSSVGGGDPTPPIGGGTTFRVTASSGVNIRSSASTSAGVIGSRGFGSTIALTGERVTADGFTWGRVVGGGWVATNFLSAI